MRRSSVYINVKMKTSFCFVLFLLGSFIFIRTFPYQLYTNNFWNTTIDKFALLLNEIGDGHAFPARQRGKFLFYVSRCKNVASNGDGHFSFGKMAGATRHVWIACIHYTDAVCTIRETRKRRIMKTNNKGR